MKVVDDARVMLEGRGGTVLSRTDRDPSRLLGPGPRFSSEAATERPRAFKMAKGSQVLPGPRGEPLDATRSPLWSGDSQECLQ